MPIIRRIQEIKEAIASSNDNDLSFITRKINVDSVVSTGSTLLDLAISGKRRRGGGIPGGIVVEIFGGAGAGKTAILAEICAHAQSLGGSVKFQDPEARLDREYSRIYDMELKADDYTRPDTVEEIFEAIKKWKPTDPSKINVVATDSLAALSTELELSPKGDKMGMKRAKEFSSGFRKTTRQITANNWLLACTNQTRQGDYGETTPGGNAIAFYSSLRLRVRQIDLIYQEKEIASGKKVKKAIGIESVVFVKKSTVDDPYREITIYIVFGYGIDDIRGNLQYIKDMNGNTKYECPDGQSYISLNAAIFHIEKEELTKVLKEQTIDLWETIEAKFDLNRIKKQR
jgi:RecA/RadA recombinase